MEQGNRRSPRRWGGGCAVDGAAGAARGVAAPRRYSPNQMVSSGRMKNGCEPGSGLPSTSP